MNVLNKGNLGRRILKRLLSLIIVVWGVVTLSFCLQVFTGTDPAERSVERENSSGRGIHPSIFNACSSKTFCQNPALWFAVVPKQEQKDDAL